MIRAAFGNYFYVYARKRIPANPIQKDASKKDASANPAKGAENAKEPVKETQLPLRGKVAEEQVPSSAPAT
jgi:hypothetical protein